MYLYQAQHYKRFVSWDIQYCIKSLTLAFLRTNALERICYLDVDHIHPVNMIHFETDISLQPLV